jgi:hypothetical protein
MTMYLRTTIAGNRPIDAAGNRPMRAAMPVLAGVLVSVLGLVIGPTAAAASEPARVPASGADIAHRGTAQPVPLPVGFRPEGVTSGPGDTYYAGSLADGRIRTGDLSRGTGRDLLAGVPGRALRGLQYDSRSGLVWAVGQDGGTGIVLVVHSRTGQLLHRFVVPGAGFLNDIVVTKKAAWVTDSSVDRLTSLRLDRQGRPDGTMSSLPLTGPWPTPTGLRANGIRELSDGSLVLDNSTAGGLWRVDPVSGAVGAIPITGGPIASGLTGGDGLVLSGRTLYVVRGNRVGVTVLTLRRTASEWTARWDGALTSPDLDVPSTATLAGHTLWAVNARFGVADPATATYSIVPLRPA